MASVIWDNRLFGVLHWKLVTFSAYSHAFYIYDTGSYNLLLVWFMSLYWFITFIAVMKMTCKLHVNVLATLYSCNFHLL